MQQNALRIAKIVKYRQDSNRRYLGKDDTALPTLPLPNKRLSNEKDSGLRGISTNESYSVMLRDKKLNGKEGVLDRLKKRE